MFVIRQAQLQQIHNAGRARFENEMVTYARETWPDLTWSLEEQDLRARIHADVDAALEFGIETERAVAGFVELQFAFGRDYSGESWIQEILDDSERDGGVRMQEIWDRIRPSDTI